MEKGTILYGIIAIAAIIGLVVVAGMKAAAPVNIQPAPERHTLSVTGTKEFFVAPDEAQIDLQIVTQAPSAKTASEMNAERISRVMQALQNAGVAASDIETTDVVLGKVTEWGVVIENGVKREQQIEKGYEQTTTIRVTVKRLDTVGAVIDAAIGAGANRVQDVRFTLQPATQARYKQEALKDAAGIARQKAEMMADAAGAELGKVVGINENTYSMPWAYNAANFAGGKDAEAGIISPERVSLSVSVSVTYELV